MDIKEIKLKQLKPKAFMQEQVESIRKTVGDGTAVVALSGGVDSSVVAILGHLALGPCLKAYFIENGIMRAGEPRAIVSLFKKLGVRVELVDAKAQFFAALAGVTDPEQKREAITQTFYKTVFGPLVWQSGARFLLQGTNYTDVEETVAGIKRQHNVVAQLGIDTEKVYGYQVLEPVIADTSVFSANPEPIRDMGRFAHEASAIDPGTGYWYLTEDRGNANTLYRFRPHNLAGGLNSLHAGGRLQGLAVLGLPNADLRNPLLCQEYPCTWVDIADPDADGATLAVAGIGNVSASGPYRQAYANGAAIFGATEGCWVAHGVVFFTDKQVTTNPARAGRIWALDLSTVRRSAERAGGPPENAIG